MKVSKLKKEDVEKAYDFLIGGKYFEPTGKVSKGKLDLQAGRCAEDAGRRPGRLHAVDRLYLTGITQVDD